MITIVRNVWFLINVKRNVIYQFIICLVARLFWHVFLSFSAPCDGMRWFQYFCAPFSTCRTLSPIENRFKLPYQPQQNTHVSLPRRASFWNPVIQQNIFLHKHKILFIISCVQAWCMSPIKIVENQFYSSTLITRLEVVRIIAVVMFSFECHQSRH